VSQPTETGAGDPGTKPLTLEGKLSRLEEILVLLEADEVELERALALFEEGVGLVREAERLLAETELKVEELLAGGGTAPFEEREG